MTISDAIRQAAKDARVLPLHPDQPATAEPDLTHDGLALELGEAWRDVARHVAAWGRWSFTDANNVWREDDRLEHMTRAREWLRAKAETLPEKDAKRLRQADMVANVVGLARSNPAQTATVDQWDADPWLLGTPEGTVNLRTGDLQPTRADHYITKTTAVAPAPAGTPAPLWLATLERTTAGNVEVLRYKQRFYGYSLTGITREHVLGFGHGLGANGKSVEVNTVGGIMRDYAMSIPTEMIMQSQGERHPTELARLRGVRLAFGNETEEGRRWAESKIKSMTGGDRIAARFMRQDFFEFTPQFKLYICGNHRPSLRGVDEAMRRRLHLVPFTVTIPPDERDHELPEKLRAEWPAILRWMIDGCLEWQRGGLNPPEIVRAATEEYLSAEDAFSLWVESCADEDPDAWESSGTLFASWKRWAESAGEQVGSQKNFGNVLQDRGFIPKRQAGTGLRGYMGLRVREPNGGQRWEP